MCHSSQHSRFCKLFFGGLFLVCAATGQVASSESGHTVASTPLVLNHSKQPHMPEERDRIIGSYGKLPLSFEANQGRVDEGSIQFLARGAKYTVFLGVDKAILNLSSPAKGQNPPKETDTALCMAMLGTNKGAKAEALDLLPGKINYFMGNDPKEWRVNIPTYARIKYTAIYPGIDLIYYGNPKQLEYDFILAPGADPHAIRLAFPGTERVGVSREGDLLLKVKGQVVRFRKPLIYQLHGESGEHWKQNGVPSIARAGV